MPTTFTSYPACFFKDDSDTCPYSVVFPDWGQATCGDTLDDAFAMAQDLLAGLVCCWKEDSKPIPQPSPIETVDPAKIARELDENWVPSATLVTMVTVDVDEYSKAYFGEQGKVTCVIPTQLKRAAEGAEIDFSQVLEEALMRELKNKPV